MLRLTAFEFVARIIPEAFLIILAMITLCNVKLNTKRYIISSLLLATCEYGIRMLPINYGVPTILDIFIIIIIIRNINKADVILSIKSSLVITIVLFICEGVNMLFLSLMFKDRLNLVIENATTKVIYGIPSLICFAIITIICHLRKRDVVYV